MKVRQYFFKFIGNKYCGGNKHYHLVDHGSKKECHRHFQNLKTVQDPNIESPSLWGSRTAQTTHHGN